MNFSSVFSRVIPTPQYLTLPSVGIDISDTSLKYIQLVPDHDTHALAIAHWGDIEIPAETVSRGVLLKPEQLTTALQEVRVKTGIAHVRISLPEERAYIFETKIKQGTPFKEIRGLLEFRLEENVPLSPRDAFFDYEVIESKTNASEMRVSVTVYARETIMGYYEAARAAGLIPLSFEVEAAAIARATLPAAQHGTHMVIDFGKTRTGVGIVHEGSLMYTSTIDIGGKELSTAMRTVLGDVPESDLTTIKNTSGLQLQQDNLAVHSVLVDSMKSITDEIALRIEYWRSHAASTHEQDVSSIILCGGSSNLQGLAGHFSSVLGIDTSLAAVWQNVFSLEDTIPPIDKRHSLGYATAVGLALAGHIYHYD